MRCRLLGNSGLRVAEISLGTMTFGEEWGWGSAKQESEQIYNAYRDAGGNFIDTANLYTGGTSETFVGEFVRGHRKEMVIATKYSNALPGKDANAAGNHRKSMVQAVEASLRRLGTDYIDLYWPHVWDGITPVDEVMRASTTWCGRARFYMRECRTRRLGGWPRPTLSPISEGGPPSWDCRLSIPCWSGP